MKKIKIQKVNKHFIKECSKKIIDALDKLNFLLLYFEMNPETEEPGTEEYDIRESVQVNRLFHDKISLELIIISVMINEIENYLNELSLSKSLYKRFKYLKLNGYYIKTINLKDVKTLINYVEEYN